MARLSNVVGLVLIGEKMEQIVADMQKKEPDCEFKLYSYGDDEYEDDCYDYDSDEVDYNKGYQWHTKY